MEKVSVFIKIRVLFWPEISALGVLFNFDNERMRPPKYSSAPPGAHCLNQPQKPFTCVSYLVYKYNSDFILFKSVVRCLFATIVKLKRTKIIIIMEESLLCAHAHMVEDLHDFRNCCSLQYVFLHSKRYVSIYPVSICLYNLYNVFGFYSHLVTTPVVMATVYKKHSLRHYFRK